ncbi:prion-like-(Q/N-rich) domain-bearing protein 25 [Diabrotica undecimpunctata]|uniref:prion-like-(Q/N-rich) domain-bearing protein 25 n=1 Tax=Diabrotica undecimpunctata TaxID=50387 RepID=UPI003B634B1F
MCHIDYFKTFLFLSLLVSCIISGISAKKGLIPCETDEDCPQLENSICDKKVKVCKCNGTSTCNIKKTKLVTKIGGECQSTEDCNIESAECMNSKCDCKKGYVKSTDGKKCLMVSEGINGNCEDSVQCYTKTPNTVCTNNKCVCEGMHEYEGKCYKSVDLGQACESNPECINKFSSCKDSVCTCNDKYVASLNESTCLLKAESNNSPCVDDIQCTVTLGKSSQCEDSVCKCKTFFHYKEKLNKCVENIQLGDHCLIHSECHDPYPEKENRVECVAGVCECRSSFTEQDGICVENSSTRVASAFFVLISIYTILTIFN